MLATPLARLLFQLGMLQECHPSLSAEVAYLQRLSEETNDYKKCSGCTKLTTDHQGQLLKQLAVRNRGICSH